MTAPSPATTLRGEFRDFVERSAAIVSACETDVVAMARSGALPQGFWHPTGFMTFEIMSVLELGLMRLHYWPRGIRRIRTNHPQIHQHCFDLYSKVISGRYLEDQYTLAADSTPTEQLSAYSVCPTYGKGYDELVEEPLAGRLDHHADHVETHAGTAHWLPAGVFHATPIPADESCCTLVVMSIPRRGVPDLVIGPKNLDVSRATRIPVANDECEALAQELSGATR